MNWEMLVCSGGACFVWDTESAEDWVKGDDPAELDAVTKIQAAFRGHQVRKKMATGEPSDPSKEQLEAEFSAEDKELCHAATKIQATFRGHMARKPKPEDEISEKMEKLAPKADGEDEELDIDLNDPDLHKAATKIQASFRGHKVRKDEPFKDKWNLELENQHSFI